MSFSPIVLNEPGTLTPMANSPLPYEGRSAVATLPVATLPQTHISRITDSFIDVTPVVSMFQNISMTQLPPVSVDYLPIISPLPSVMSLPAVINQLPVVSLPMVNYPIINQQVPIVSLPSTPIFNSGYLHLSDNEVGSLKWNRPNAPQPTNPRSVYRRIGCIADGNCFFHAVAKGLSKQYQLSYRPYSYISEEELRKFEIAGQFTFPGYLFDSVRSSDENVQYRINDPIAFTKCMDHFRQEYVKMLRQDFANLILNEERMQNIIANRLTGSIDLEADNVLEEAREKNIAITPSQARYLGFQKLKQNLAQELLSEDDVRADFVVLLSDYSNIDIYLLRDIDLINPNPRNTPLYGGSSQHAAVYGPADMRFNNDSYISQPNRTAIVIIAVNDNHYELIGRVDEIETERSVSRRIRPDLNADEPLIRRLYEMLRELR